MSKKIKIQITSWLNGSVLFEYEAVDNTMKKTVEAAVKGFADLGYADLRYANLGYANLSFADLGSANLGYADLRYANLGYAKNLNSDATDFWWHVHHQELVEQLTEPVRARINYIKKDKPQDEIELRLKLLKPVLGEIPTTKKGWNDLHKEECGCGWNGKTIFTKKNGLEKDVKWVTLQTLWQKMT